MKKVLIVAGENKGKTAIIAGKKTEEIGNGLLYQLKDLNGLQLWNGNYANFPQSFIKILNEN